MQQTQHFTQARDAFDLEPGEVHLNHGSFGAVPRAAAQRQDGIRCAMRRNFHRFYDRSLFPLLEGSRLAVAGWLGADPGGFVFTTNATTALTTALSCIAIGPGDEVLTTDVEYHSTYANLRRACAAAGASIVVVPVAGLDDAAVVDQLMDKVGPRTVAVVASAVTSPWSTLLPVHALHDALAGHRAVLVVDGAHGPGLMDVDLARLPDAFYCTTLHKWACFPHGTGALQVPDRFRPQARPLVDALFAGSTSMTERFAWSGTDDVSGFLVAEEVLAVHQSAAANGWTERAVGVAGHARRQVVEAWPDAVPVSDPRVRRMITWRLPGVAEDRLSRFLRDRGVWTWLGAADGETHLRLSAAWYSTVDDVDRLAHHLREFRRLPVA